MRRAQARIRLGDRPGLHERGQGFLHRHHPEALAERHLLVDLVERTAPHVGPQGVRRDGDLESEGAAGPALFWDELLADDRRQRERELLPNLNLLLGWPETTALPVAVRKKMGVLGMKVFAQEALVGQATPRELLYYTLSLPVTAAVVGMPKLELLEENVRLARAFQPLPAAEMKELSGRLSARNKLALDRFFERHVDA